MGGHIKTGGARGVSGLTGETGGWLGTHYLAGSQIEELSYALAVVEDDPHFWSLLEFSKCRVLLNQGWEV
jgi:hypothetical protein